MSYPIKHLSASSISLYKNCTWCWYHYYISHKKPNLIYPFLEYGKKYHEHVHNYHTGKTYDQTLIEKYTEKYLPFYRLRSEIEFTETLPGIDIPIYGFIDGINDKGISDLKTGKSIPNTKLNIQAILYSQVYKLWYLKLPKFTFNCENGDKPFKNVSVQTTEDDFKQLKLKVIYPMLAEIIEPEKIELNGNSYGIHKFKECPFIIAR